jgi:hypothetical protein
LELDSGALDEGWEEEKGKLNSSVSVDVVRQLKMRYQKRRLVYRMLVVEMAWVQRRGKL